MREQIHTTGQAKLSEKQKWRISVKLTILPAHLYQFVPGTNRHKREASFVRNTSVFLVSKSTCALRKIKVQCSNFNRIQIHE